MSEHPTTEAPQSPDEISDYDPRWPGLYRGERDRVRLGLATASLFYEHVGSTAVPGMGGRPVVDILMGASPAVWATVEELRPRATALGYQDAGDGGRPGCLVFRLRRLHAFDLTLVALDGPAWRDTLALRDYLRAHPEEAAAFTAARRAVPAAHAALRAAIQIRASKP